MLRPKDLILPDPDDRTIISRGLDTVTVMGDNQPYLHIIHPRDRAFRYPITADGLMLGRGTDVDVYLPDAKVSRHHCRIKSDPQGISVEDLGSTNGTLIDGEIITKSILAPSARLKVGGYVMRVDYRAKVEITAEEQLKEAARTDDLTGVPNRRSFYQEASGVLVDSVLRNINLSFVMIDIDHFKRVNDRFGHAAGDHVIRQVATTLMVEKRSTDLLARFGGEEFIMLLPDTTSEEAFLYCDRLCEKIAWMAITHEDKPIQVRVSIGVHSRLAGEFSSIEAAIRAADEAMYRAKRDGRNRVST